MILMSRHAAVSQTVHVRSRITETHVHIYTSCTAQIHTVHQ